MNKVAIIAVALVKKSLADLENMKLSWETPIPRAPPSDFCNKINIIYGGSVNVNNIKELNVVQNINGFLIGGASQSGKKFIDIIKNCYM